jgi:hypothetical protein
MVVRLLLSNLFSTPGQRLITSADSIKRDVIYVPQKMLFLTRYYRFSEMFYTLECWVYLLGKFTDFSEGCVTSIFRVYLPKKTELTYTEFGDNMLLRNGYNYLPVDTA